MENQKSIAAATQDRKSGTLPSLHPLPGWADLEQLAAHYKRMGDDNNAVRLRHLEPCKTHDEKVRDTAQAAAAAYYNAHRMLVRFLPNTEDVDASR